MLRLTLVMMMLALARGQSTTPLRCCVSHQFTASMGEIADSVQGSHLVHQQGSVQVAFDYDAKLLGLHSSVVNSATGTATDSTVLQDFNTRIQYVWTANGECFHQAIPGDLPMIEPCIPASATYMTSITMGAGHVALPVNIWTFQMPDGQGGQTKVNLAVSADDCTPVIEEMFGHVMGSPESDITYFFTNYKPSIADRSLLTIPAAGTCKQMPAGGGTLVGR